MTSAKTAAWLAVFATLSLPTVRADALTAPNGSWQFFGGVSNLGSEYPSLFGTAVPAAPVPSEPVAAQVAPVADSANIPTPVATPASPSTYDALINFGTSNYPEQSTLTTGTAAPWYASPSVTQFFGGNQPNAAQQWSFENSVMQDIQHTFALAGMNPTLTTDQAAAANHTISVVSGLSYAPNANAIGITDVGGNGFGFIDKLGSASSLTDLEWAVAHNVSHELMHAFGIGYHPDQTGTYIDAASATWSVLTSPNTTFSPAAAVAIEGTNYGAMASGTTTAGLEKIDGDQEILAQPVPEPTTLALWAVALGGMAIHGRGRTRSRRAA